ncbi:aldose epimerase family protein [Coprobacter secundus]|uniref:Aldose 1-epimerase n=1 Tax=Coprobacter secundus subsp. similis TaxID=2751153 RepID=A0A7G1HYR3_9BACT|nr:aldose epimerase family protein [Coprobacter secundus]BCI64835.1 aldose 1-epimerase [Coprobacter secundus subsp. similis]
MKSGIFFLLTMTLGLFSCIDNQQEIKLVDADNFTSSINGKNVNLYTLKSKNGMTMQVTNYGGHVVSLWVPDKNGHFDDIVLGHNTLKEYIDYEGERFIGCVVGRYANRIANGQFYIDSIRYNIPQNNNGQSLHGGLKGLDQVIWDVDSVTPNKIFLSYTSPDGEEGYPGTLKLNMDYSLTDDNEFIIQYHATTDKPTVINLSHHGFFNLKGEGRGSINDHLLTIYADSITPVNDVLIPTGQLMAVEGTPFDFRKATAIGKRVDTDNEQLKNANGYDHNWVLNRKSAYDIELAASVYEPSSGRYLEVLTDQPGLQFYGGNFFNGSGKGKYNPTIDYREALALETQKFPDSPNQPNFPSTRLNPDETYRHTCIYKFSIK